MKPVSIHRTTELLLIAVLCLPSVAEGIWSRTNDLPPPGIYASEGGAISAYGVTLSGIRLYDFTQSYPAPNGYSTLNFDATCDFSLDAGISRVVARDVHMSMALLLDDWWESFRGYMGHIDQLDLIVPGTVGQTRVRKSPDRSSIGILTIVGTASTWYQIESWFDVPFDLSIDGGQTWSAAGGARFTLVPEPAAASLLIIGSVQLLRRCRGPARR